MKMPTAATTEDIRVSHPDYNKTSPCRHAYVDLPDGRTVSFFVNRETRLIVVDVVDADDKGGVEILRYTAPEAKSQRRRVR